MSQTRKTKAIEKIAKEKQAKLTKKLVAIIAAVAVVATLAAVIFVQMNKITPDQYPVVSMDVEGYGVVEITLYPDKAPNTVRNFISLIESEYYDGQKILRISEDFVVQIGSPDGTLSGGPGYTIKGEFAANGYTKNDIKHEEGVLSMARGGQSYDSAGSQFFICTATNSSVSYLDGQYAAFGKVTKGLDIIKQLNEVEHDNSISAGGGVPLKDIIINSITVDKKGVSYKQPTIIK